MEEFDQSIYNTYLAVSRSVNGKPFKLRKDFSKFHENKHYMAVLKLGKFFKKFPHIDVNSFFEAPFFVYEEDHFDLEFFCTQKAVATYTKYHDHYLIDNPNSTECLKKIKQSIEFILTYCKNQDISPKMYMHYIEPGTSIQSFLFHLKTRSINVYTLFAFKDFERKLWDIEPEIKELYAGILMRVAYIRTKLYTANKAKKNVDLFKQYVDNGS